MRQAAEESSITAQRDYVEAAEALLTQLQPFETSSTRAGVWRRPPGSGDSQDRGGDPTDSV
jgi:hypothetical protein